MSGPLRIAAFVVAVAILSAFAALAGAAIDPKGETASEEHGAGAEHGAGSEPVAVRGLGVAEGDLRIVVEDGDLRRGRAERLTYRIVGRDGRTVRAFDTEHEKKMHLIVVRRDLTGFQHLHPEQRPDGSWTTAVRIGEAGSYRLFADFARHGKPHTLASDLRVSGAADLRGLPAPAATARTSDGYDVRLTGAGDDLDFAITRGGRPVEVEPYLGANGHLVALREGDLAFLHVHPHEGGGVRFTTAFPTPGNYRLFLQFKHEGRVHTAAFTKQGALTCAASTCPSRG